MHYKSSLFRELSLCIRAPCAERYVRGRVQSESESEIQKRQRSRRQPATVFLYSPFYIILSLYFLGYVNLLAFYVI